MGTDAVNTLELLQAFGWDRAQRNQQQDAGEFWMLLSDCLEREMKGTSVDRLLNDMFEGEIEQVVQCTNINYESSSKELFTVLQVPL